MKKLVWSLATACCLLAPSLAQAVTYREMETVNSYGVGTYGVPSGGTIAISGVVLCNPTEMNSSTLWWQTFVQSLNSNDYGGVALWDGYKNYSGDQSVGVASYLQGLNLNYGDLVTVTFYTGNVYNGKFNITDDHGAGTLFTVDVTGHADTVSSTAITLADLKNTDNTFHFDSSRNEGCEYYQGTLVSLTGLKLVDPDDWGIDQTVTVQQTVNGVDYTFDLLLGSNSSLELSAATLASMKTDGFDLTAILDQEDTGTTITDEDAEDFGMTYYTSGYRLWLTSTENGALTVVPEPGTLALCLAGGFASLLMWRRRRTR